MKFLNGLAERSSENRGPEKTSFLIFTEKIPNIFAKKLVNKIGVD